jgi:choline dehydrogenase-like flavoprotein
MTVDDLRLFETGRVIDTDLCIVGSGPAGLTIAGEFAGTRVSVLILESGGLQEEAAADALNEIENVGAPRDMRPGKTHNRIVGGTSHSWAGRCAPLDDVDFKVRTWVPHSGWPITRTELDPYFDRAAPYLGIAPQGYDGRLWHRPGEPDIDTSVLRPCFWQYSQDASNASEPMRFGRRFLRSTSPNIRILHHATVQRIRINEAGTHLDSVLVGSLEGKTATVRPKMLVLCTGGIETARLLLCSNDMMPAGVGNANGLVGRFLMDHPRCPVAEFDVRFVGRILDRLGRHRLSREAGRPIYIHGLALSPTLQEQMRLLNCSAWLDARKAEDDPLAIAKRLLTGHERRPVRNSLKVVSQPGTFLRGVRDYLTGRAEVTRKYCQLVLQCTVEQRPDPESRICLAGRTDALGMNLSQIDWRINDQERDSAATLGKLIIQEFARIGFPVPRLVDWAASGRHDEAEFIDIAHPIGATRMADDPHDGVVDANCQIHGIDGIFVAGSSVFPTGGHVNPTQTIVALSIRLADWLKTRIFRAGCSDAGAL